MNVSKHFLILASFRATDCINGTLLDQSLIPTPSMNFTTLWGLYANETRPVDPDQRFLPMQSELTIYNSSRLYINLDACVNTLRGECKDFFASHGRDGRNKSAQSRYPCFYDKVQLFLNLFHVTVQPKCSRTDKGHYTLSA